jgi:hypothetical protein
VARAGQSRSGVPCGDIASEYDAFAPDGMLRADAHRNDD